MNMRCDEGEEWSGELLYTYSSSFFGCSYILFFFLCFFLIGRVSEERGGNSGLRTLLDNMKMNLWKDRLN